MAEYGEWNRKGAVLNDVTAEKENGVSRDFIVEGIKAGKLEYREGAVWGNPFLRILRSQLEPYISGEARFRAPDEHEVPDRVASLQCKNSQDQKKVECARRTKG